MSLGVETKITVSDMNIWTSQFHMASASSAPLLKSTVSFSFTIVLIILASLQTASGCFTSIFAFGDSLTDPGNYVNIYPQIFPQNQSPPRIGLPPYGETYFHHPTGRCSNGRLIVDFIAEYYGLPLIPPYIRGVNQNGSDFEVGVNFAVQGVPALDVAFYEEQGIHYTLSNISMSTQLRWFRELLPSLCNSSIAGCSEAFKHSLFLMGSFGGNDYGNAFQQGKSLEEIKSFTPLIISAISSAIEDLIDLGAVNIMVPGILPDGCLPVVLANFQGSNKEDYDPVTGCLNRWNQLSKYHNELLQEELNQIREFHPDAVIIYADYFNALMQLYLSPEKYGFGGRSLMACCGAGGPPYNFNPTAQCGKPPSTACAQPSLYINWDGVHSTEAAYAFMANGLLEGTYTTPRINTWCISKGKDLSALTIPQ